MKSSLRLLIATLVIGIIATGLLDIFNLARHLLLEQPLTRYEHIGRWVLHALERQQFVLKGVPSLPVMPYEMFLGWFGHYFIGTVFAAILLLWKGKAWLAHPRLVPALVIGILTSIVPFLVVQPGMGAGIAGMATSDPLALQLKVLVTHVVFGVGLYMGGRVCRPSILGQ